MHYPVGYNRSLMIFLLVTYVIQVDRCSADDGPAPATDATATATDATAAAADATATAGDGTAKAGDVTPTDADNSPSPFSNCKTDLDKSITVLGQSAGMLMKAFGHTAMAVMNFLIGSYNSVAAGAAATGEMMAAGLNLVNNAASSVVLLRDVTSGAATVATGMATTYRKNTEYNIENRQQLFNMIDSRLDNYHPESEQFLMASAASQGQTTDTTAAATATENAAAPVSAAT